MRGALFSVSRTRQDPEFNFRFEWRRGILGDKYFSEVP
jgi:hypothetical protein